MTAFSVLRGTIENGVLVVFKRKKVDDWEALLVDSFEEIYANESVILERIKLTPNGGILFALNPLLLLRDIKVILSPKLAEAWCEREPRLKKLRDADYERMKANPVLADVRVNVKGLFHHAAQEAV